MGKELLKQAKAKGKEVKMSKPTILDIINKPEDYKLIEVWEEYETEQLLIGEKGWTDAYLAGYLIVPQSTKLNEKGEK